MKRRTLLQALTCLPVLACTLPAQLTGPVPQEMLEGMQYLLDNHQNISQYLERLAEVDPQARPRVANVQLTVVSLAQQLKRRGMVEHTKEWHGDTSVWAMKEWSRRFGVMELKSHQPHCGQDPTLKGSLLA